jgi:acetyl esterase
MSTVESTRLQQLDPDTAAFLQTLEAQGGPPLYTLSPDDARAVLVNVQNVPVKKLPTETEDHTITGGPTGEVALRIVRPQGIAGTLPVVLYFHGGGWVLGDKTTHDRLIRELATGAQVAVVFVDFARSPEARYPVALEQGYTALQWVAKEGTAHNLDASRLALAGDSVGGNLAAALALLAKQRGGPKVNFQALFYPVTDADMETPSYREFGAGGYWLTRDAMRWFWDSYAPDASVRHQPTVSPLRASLEDLRGLPPALVITDECDVLRDEGEAYAHKLMNAGVRVTATRYLGTIHDFMLLNAITQTPAPRGAIIQANIALRLALTR